MPMASPGTLTQTLTPNPNPNPNPNPIPNPNPNFQGGREGSIMAFGRKEIVKGRVRVWMRIRVRVRSRARVRNRVFMLSDIRSTSPR